jgi:hypothetical protein
MEKPFSFEDQTGSFYKKKDLFVGIIDRILNLMD